MKVKAVLGTLVGVILFAGMVSSVKEPQREKHDVELRSADHATANAAVAKGQVLAAYNKLPLRFEPNQGQTDPQVRFFSQGTSYRLFLDRRGEAVLALHSPIAAKPPRIPAVSRRAGKSPRSRASTPVVAEDVLRLSLLGGSSMPESAGVDQLPGKSNYFIGNNPKDWRTNIPTYAKVKYEGIYPGVDLVYYGNQGQLEYDFVVSAGRDPSPIGFGIQGAKSVRVDDRGDLVLETREGSVRLNKPVAYQLEQESSAPEEVGGRRLVAAKYVVDRGPEVHFRLGAYDSSKPLIIDPSVTLTYSSYLGGSGNEMAAGVATDGKGGAYVSGLTFSTNFPVTTPAGTLNKICGTGSVAPCQDIFVAKFDTTKLGVASLVYATFLGGNGQQDFVVESPATPAVSSNGIAIDSAGNAYVTGNTNATDFPVKNALQPNCALSAGKCVGNAVITELNSAGDALLYSTYLGGSGGELGNGIAVDAAGLIYVTGETFSPTGEFPASVPSDTFGGSCIFPAVKDVCDDAFVAKIDPTKSGLSSRVYAIYLGFAEFGDADDPVGGGQAIAADSNGNAYITGGTDEASAFAVVNGFQTITKAGFDAFLVKLDPKGANILYATFMGGNGEDLGSGVAVDEFETAYITGFTISSNFPTKNGLTPPTDVATGGENAFVARIDTAVPGGGSLLYSTYLGGKATDFGASVAALSSPSGVVFVAGTTFSADFPTTPNALALTLSGTSDAFVTELDTNITGNAGLLFSTFLGGSMAERGIGIAIDSGGNAFVSGNTESSDFPVTALSAFQSKLNGTGSGAGSIADAFIAELSVGAPPTEPAVTFSANGGFDFGSQLVTTKSGPKIVTVTNTGNAPLTISGIAVSGGDFAKTTDTCNPAILAPFPAPNDSCTITLTFTPSVTGARAGELTVTDNAPSSPQSVALSGTGSDFALGAQAGSSTSKTVSAGGTATYMLQVAPVDGFIGAVALTADCSSVPKETSCTVSSASTNVNGGPAQFTLAVGTTGNALVPPFRIPRVEPPTSRWTKLLVFGFLAMLLFLIVFEARRRVGAHGRWNLLAPSAALVLVLLIGGCGGGSSSGGGGGTNGTAPGSYTVIVNGSSQGVQHSLNLTLKVQ